MPELLAVRGIEKLSPAGRAELVRVADRLGVPPSDLAAVISFETAGSFDPAQKNLAGGSAIGLIQFMPPTARMLGTTSRELAAMTVVEQLAYVEKYFHPVRSRLRDASDLYMAVIAPIGIGKPPGFVLYSKGGNYSANSRLDQNKDHKITKAEAARPVQNILFAARNRPRIVVDMSATEPKRGRTIVGPAPSTPASSWRRDPRKRLAVSALLAAAVGLVVVRVVEGPGAILGPK